MVQQTSVRVLSARSLAGEAYGHLFANLPAWITASALPFVLLVVIDYATWQSVTEETARGAAAQLQFAGGLRGILKSLVDAIIYTFFAVAWHRQILLSEAPRLIPSVGASHVRFLFWTLAITLMALFVMFTIAGLFQMIGGGMAIGVLGGLLGAILSIYFFCRVCVVCPDAAIGGRMGLVRAWERTRGEVWPIFLAFVLVIIPILAATLALMALLGVAFMQRGQPQGVEALTSGPNFWLFSAASVLLFLVSIAVSVSVASNAYKALMSKPRPAGGLGRSAPGQ